MWSNLCNTWYHHLHGETKYPSVLRATVLHLLERTLKILSHKVSYKLSIINNKVSKVANNFSQVILSRFELTHLHSMILLREKEMDSYSWVIH